MGPHKNTQTQYLQCIDARLPATSAHPVPTEPTHHILLIRNNFHPGGVFTRAPHISARTICAEGLRSDPVAATLLRCASEILSTHPACPQRHGTTLLTQTLNPSRTSVARNQMRLQTYLHVARRLRDGRACQVMVGQRPWVIEAVVSTDGGHAGFVARDASAPDETCVQAGSVAALMAALQARRALDAAA